MLPILAKPGAWKLFGHFARYGALSQPKIEQTVDLAPGETLDVPGQPQVIATPGHTDGHVVFHFPQHRVVFVGDSICTWHPITGERGPQQMAFNVSNSEALDSLSLYENSRCGPAPRRPRRAVDRRAEGGSGGRASGGRKVADPVTARRQDDEDTDSERADHRGGHLLAGGDGGPGSPWRVRLQAWPA